MNKNILIILSTLCALVLVTSAWVLTRPQLSPTDVETLGLTEVRGDAVTSLTRRDLGGTTVAKKDGDVWSIDGAHISPTSIELLVDSLQRARAQRVANNGRSVPAYGFAERVTNIAIESDDVTISIDVGAVGPSAQSVYVARPDSGEVFLLEGTTLGDVAHEDWQSWLVASSSATSSAGL